MAKYVTSPTPFEPWGPKQDALLQEIQEIVREAKSEQRLSVEALTAEIAHLRSLVGKLVEAGNRLRSFAEVCEDATEAEDEIAAWDAAVKEASDAK
jgi:hypothetical protein